MVNFDFKRTSRKCSISGRSFESGEEYVSLLVEEDDELIRKDIALSEFDAPPENCVGWWKSRVPDLDKGTVYWAPKDVLMSYFQHLIQQPDSPDMVYVMAILLLQKKHLRLLETTVVDEVESMSLICHSTKEKFDVKVVEVSQERDASIQNEMAEKLFTDIAPSEGQN